MMPIRVLIVDDEPIPRRGLRRLLDRDPEFEVVGECGNGDTARAEIEALRPDLVLLDVQMPGLDGFQVLAAIPVEKRPHVVFVTAYDEYALKAFQFHALDYLLKPFSARRFDEAMARAKAQIRGRDIAAMGRRLEEFLDRQKHLASRYSSPASRLAVKDGDRVILVDTSRIRWIEAKHDYTEVHTVDGVYLIRRTMKQLEKELDSSRFARIHRSTMVNIGEVVELRPLFRGDSAVLLRDGTELRLSRRRRDEFCRALGLSI